MYICEPRQHVEFYDFDKSTNLSDKFKKTLHTFEDAGKENSFFAAILFGLLTKLSDSGDFTEAFVAKILGREVAKKFLCEKENLQLDYCFESFFDKRHLVNDLLEEKNLFLRVCERRDKFRFLIKKGISGKNKVIRRDLSSCIIRKFNGYKITSIKFKKEQKKFFLPLYVVYEPTSKNKNILCYCAEDLSFTNRSYYSRKRKGK